MRGRGEGWGGGSGNSQYGWHAQSTREEREGPGPFRTEPGRACTCTIISIYEAMGAVGIFLGYNLFSCQLLLLGRAISLFFIVSSVGAQGI